MPQLMPLMWVSSAFMSILILFMLVDMYYYKMDLNILIMNFNQDNNNINFMW